MDDRDASPIIAVDHVNITTREPEVLARRLRQVLGLTVAWPLTDYGGPDLVLTAGHANQVSHLVFAVSDPEAAAAAFHRQEIEAQRTSKDGITLSPAPLDGLAVTLRRGNLR